MKCILYFLGLFLLVSIGCTKENDDATTVQAENVQMKSVDFLSDVEPFLRKSCTAAHCHGTTGRAFTSREVLLPLLADGSFEQRIFVLGNSTPCGILSDASLGMLRQWIDQGSRME